MEPTVAATDFPRKALRLKPEPHSSCFDNLETPFHKFNWCAVEHDSPPAPISTQSAGAKRVCVRTPLRVQSRRGASNFLGTHFSHRKYALSSRPERSAVESLP